MSEAFQFFMYNLNSERTAKPTKQKTSILQTLLRDINTKTKSIHINQVIEENKITPRGSIHTSYSKRQLNKRNSDLVLTPISHGKSHSQVKPQKPAMFEIKSYQARLQTASQSPQLVKQHSEKFNRHIFEEQFKRYSLEFKPNFIKSIRSTECASVNHNDIITCPSQLTLDNSQKDISEFSHHGLSYASPINMEFKLKNKNKKQQVNRPTTVTMHKEEKMAQMRKDTLRMKHMFNTHTHSLNQMPSALFINTDKKINEFKLGNSKKNIIEEAKRNQIERNNNVILRKTVYSRYSKKQDKKEFEAKQEATVKQEAQLKKEDTSTDLIRVNVPYIESRRLISVAINTDKFAA